MAALNPSTTGISRSSRRDATTITAALVAAVIFGFVALTLTALVIGLMVAVSFADSGRITVKPSDLAIARDALDYGWLIGLAAVANVAGLVGALYATRIGSGMATVVAGTGFALATALWVGVMLDGADGNGIGISLAAMGTYLVALAAAMVLRLRQTA